MVLLHQHLNKAFKDRKHSSFTSYYDSQEGSSETPYTTISSPLAPSPWISYSQMKNFFITCSKCWELQQILRFLHKELTSSCRSKDPAPVSVMRDSRSGLIRWRHTHTTWAMKTAIWGKGPGDYGVPVLFEGITQHPLRFKASSVLHEGANDPVALQQRQRGPRSEFTVSPSWHQFHFPHLPPWRKRWAGEIKPSERIGCETLRVALSL